jgi:prevent-host-death family protein
MKSVAASDLRKDCAKIISEVEFGHERVIIQRHGQAAAVIMPLEDLALLEALEDEQDLEDARVARAEAIEKGTKPLSTYVREQSEAR